MRDPARIDRILEKLRRYWHANPDLRLGQIVWNACDDAHWLDVFGIDDEVLARQIPEAPEVKP